MCTNSKHRRGPVHLAGNRPSLHLIIRLDFCNLAPSKDLCKSPLAGRPLLLIVIHIHHEPTTFLGASQNFPSSKQTNCHPKQKLLQQPNSRLSEVRPTNSQARAAHPSARSIISHAIILNPVICNLTNLNPVKGRLPLVVSQPPLLTHINIILPGPPL